VTAKLATLLTALAAEVSPPTAVTDPAEAVDVHIADSLSGLDAPPLPHATRIADIGAGAGFPGLVLAAALPNTQVDLIESTARKCEVIARLATAAGIDNATAIPARAEEWATSDGASRYEVVTARALSSLAVLAEYAAPLLELDGVLVAWKGARDPAEEHAGTEAAQILGLTPGPPIPVRPFKGSRERNLYLYTKTTPTPDHFPRRPGMATKRPLG
jgi:16S rRNA (guanine527-N7)-methyltransferase